MFATFRHVYYGGVGRARGAQALPIQLKTLFKITQTGPNTFIFTVKKI